MTAAIIWAIFVYHFVANVGMDEAAGTFPTKQSCQLVLAQKVYGFGYHGECKPAAFDAKGRLHAIRRPIHVR